MAVELLCTRQLRTMKLTKLEVVLLCMNLVALGGLLVLMALRGPNGPAILLAIGAAGMATAKIGKMFMGTEAVPPHGSGRDRPQP